MALEMALETVLAMVSVLFCVKKKTQQHLSMYNIKNEFCLQILTGTGVGALVTSYFHLKPFRHHNTL